MEADKARLAGEVADAEQTRAKLDESLAEVGRLEGLLAEQ
jgi:hypothetical protein